jgi:hypothetical protein
LTRSLSQNRELALVQQHLASTEQLRAQQATELTARDNRSQAERAMFEERLTDSNSRSRCLVLFVCGNSL